MAMPPLRDMRVRVFRRRHAVRGPASVGDADGSVQRLRIERVLKGLDLAHRAQSGHMPVIEHRQAGRIVAAIFQTTQPLHEDGKGRFCTSINTICYLLLVTI
jgi:hypothetical protein